MINIDRVPHVWGITGNLGGGKTLSAVSLAVSAIKSGFFVCSNVTLNLDAISRYVGFESSKLYMHISLDDPLFDPFKLPVGTPRGQLLKKRVLVILDECAEWVDQYSSAKNPQISRLWSWLRHSNKLSQDVIIIVQRAEYLNKVIRILISRWLVIDDLSVWRAPIIRMRLPFCSGLVMQRNFDRYGRLLSSPYFASKRFWGQFYSTAECLNSSVNGHLEYASVSRKDKFPFFLLLLWLLSCIFLFVGCASNKCFKGCTTCRENVCSISVLKTWVFVPSVSRGIFRGTLLCASAAKYP